MKHTKHNYIICKHKHLQDKNNEYIILYIKI